MTDDNQTVTFEVELTRPVAEQVVAAAQLSGVHPVEFIDAAILGRLQALDNVIHDDTVTDLPEDFDPDAWRERYESIRRLKTPDEYEPGKYL